MGRRHLPRHRGNVAKFLFVLGCLCLRSARWASWARFCAPRVQHTPWLAGQLWTPYGERILGVGKNSNEKRTFLCRWLVCLCLGLTLRMVVPLPLPREDPCSQSRLAVPRDEGVTRGGATAFLAAFRAMLAQDRPSSGLPSACFRCARSWSRLELATPRSLASFLSHTFTSVAVQAGGVWALRFGLGKRRSPHVRRGRSSSLHERSPETCTVFHSTGWTQGDSNVSLTATEHSSRSTLQRCLLCTCTGVHGARVRHGRCHNVSGRRSFPLPPELLICWRWWISPTCAETVALWAAGSTCRRSVAPAASFFALENSIKIVARCFSWSKSERGKKWVVVNDHTLDVGPSTTGFFCGGRGRFRTTQV